MLDALRDLGGSGTPDEVAERIAANLGLSDEFQDELLASGVSRYRKNVAFARFFLAKEGLVDSSERGVWSLTERGRAASLSLEQSRELHRRWARIFQEARRAKASPLVESAEQVGDDRAPLAYPATADTLATPGDHRDEVIELLLGLPPAGFERLSQRLLREAGFTEVVVTGRRGDEGIDGYGTFQVNSLISFKVLFQCKRYRGSVPPSVVGDFRGTMSGRTDKGIIITTGVFTAEARREASRDGVDAIELIDGERLVGLLEKFELGLREVRAYELDGSFFDEFRR